MPNSAFITVIKCNNRKFIVVSLEKEIFQTLFH